MNEGYELALPFICVESMGGPYDDVSFVAGFRLGQIHSRLARENISKLREVIKVDEVAQCDLIAMRFGYRMKAGQASDDGWVRVVFRRPDL